MRETKRMSDVKVTPMIKQYLDIKANYQDALLLYRMGDFYEVFFDDAKRFSQILSLTLTSRGGVPMAGVPHHSIDPYLQRLLKTGMKVAICEQVEDPKMSKGIVKREVTQVFTPGVIAETNYLDSTSNNYIMSYFYNGKDSIAIVLCDVSTGEMLATEEKISSEDMAIKLLQDNIARFCPKEILTSETISESIFCQKLQKIYPDIYYSTALDYTAEQSYAYTTLKEHFNTLSLKGFGIEDKNYIIKASSMLINYLKDMQKTVLPHIQSIQLYNRNDYMVLDESTQNNLEIISSVHNNNEYTLFSVIDHTKTSMGKRLLKRIIVAPLVQVDAINERLSYVEYFYKDIELLESVRETLSKTYDIQRLISKLSLKRINPKEMITLKQSLINALEIILKLALKGFDVANIDYADDIRNVIDTIEKAILDEPNNSINEGDIIKDTFSEELTRYNNARRDGHTWIRELEYNLREYTGITNLKIKYNNVIGYYIEVLKSAVKDVPKDFIKRQTLLNNERYTTETLLEYEKAINEANEVGFNLETEIFIRIREEVAEYTSQIIGISNVVSWIDVYSSFAYLAINKNYIKPTIDESGIIDIKNGRHAVVENYVQSSSFIPNDVYLDSAYDTLLIITGPNMSGKSTYLRQTALIVLLAQIGSFIPASSAHIGVVDRIFTRVGANDNISRGESTFLLEMNESANILNNATSKSLIIMDEIGRGTSTYDGMSIAWAIIEYIVGNKNKRAKTLFATHYHELTHLENIEGIKNYSVQVQEHKDEVIFMKKVVPGAAQSSYGIYAAKLAGIPKEVTNRAVEILKQLEHDGGVQVGTIEKSLDICLDENALPLFDNDYKTTTMHSKSLAKSVNEETLSEIEKELANIDISNTTPLEAISIIDKWKNMLG